MNRRALAESGTTDQSVRRAIAYLDSATDYCECLRGDQPTRPTPFRSPRSPRVDIDRVILIGVPVLLIVIELVFFR